MYLVLAARNPYIIQLADLSYFYMEISHILIDDGLKLRDKIDLGRVVCELLTTQICGPRDMNQI
jgi:hypothetical protein